MYPGRVALQHPADVDNFFRFGAVTSFNFDNVQFGVGDFVTSGTAGGVSLTNGLYDLSTGLQVTIDNSGSNGPNVNSLHSDPPDDVPEPGSLALLASTVLGTA